jgi:ribosomal protein S27E
MPVKFNFSMTRISCPTCGLSYDATRNKFCPGCGNEYEIISDDWALVELRYR